jgi:predicted nucleic acid-binding protein
VPGAGEPRRLFVDSGARIALRRRRDQYHAEADRLFREALRRRIPLVTTDLVLAELHRLTLFWARVQPALRALDRIDQSPSVTVHFVVAEHHSVARRWLERLAPHPVTCTGAVSFAVMEGLRCPPSRSITTSSWRGSSSGALPGSLVTPRARRAQPVSSEQPGSRADDFDNLHRRRRRLHGNRAQVTVRLLRGAFPHTM